MAERTDTTDFPTELQERAEELGCKLHHTPDEELPYGIECPAGNVRWVANLWGVANRLRKIAEAT